ncbi:MAG: ATP synthase subunit I [Candidatus Acidiferrum sp.]
MLQNPDQAESSSQTSVSAVQAPVTEQRIAWLTLVIGFLGAVVAGWMGHWPWAEGLAAGTVLGWLNFRLLRRGLDALVATSIEQAGASRVRMPQIAFLLAMLRYSLIAVCVYVIFERTRIPLVSILVGLCALGAAAIAASVYEILRPGG